MYKLRFVQKIKKENQERFLKLEKKFMELEKNEPGMPKGRRFLPVMGRDASNTLVWEAEFESMEALTAGLAAIEGNCVHDELLKEQVLCMGDTYTEIYREFEG